MRNKKAKQIRKDAKKIAADLEIDEKQFYKVCKQVAKNMPIDPDTT